MLEYLDFDLEIGESNGEDYSLSVLRSPVGEAQAVFHFPFDDLALERYQDKLQIALLRSVGRHRLALRGPGRLARRPAVAVLALFVITGLATAVVPALRLRNVDPMDAFRP